MVGGHRVAEHRQCPCTLDIADHRHWPGNVVEERWVLDIGRVVLPDISRRLRHFDGLPLCVAGKDLRILFMEHGRVDLGHGLGDFLLTRPDITQEHGLAILAQAQRLTADVDAYGAGQGIGNHQWWRGQPVGLDQGVDPAFEVAVAGEYRGHGQVGLHDGFFYRLGQGAGVADAGGAAVAHQIETQCVEVGGQPCSLVVIGHHL
ncbi:hypothetical protein D9M71_422160 [compost metagenome]